MTPNSESTHILRRHHGPFSLSSLTHASAARYFEVKAHCGPSPSPTKLCLFRPPSYIPTRPSQVAMTGRTDESRDERKPLSLFPSLVTIPANSTYIRAATSCCQNQTITSCSHPFHRSGSISNAGLYSLYSLYSPSPPPPSEGK